MKSLILFAGILLPALTFAQRGFSNLPRSSDSTYAYTAVNPLRLKKGGQQKSISYSVEFLKSLETADHQRLMLLRRSSIGDPRYEKPKVQLNSRYTGMPLNGKLCILDKYIFITSQTRDTLTIYVDVYNNGELRIPIGLDIKNE
jgi:hypothetical protein